MPTFELETVPGLPPHPVVAFCKLSEEGRCRFDEFWQAMELAGNQKEALVKLQSIMAEMCHGKRVPTKWFQELKHRSKSDRYPDYEIRAKQLRLYLFEDEEAGRVIVLGELKKGSKAQSKAIEKMRRIKLAYFAAKEANHST